ncbi:MAG: hypothetical protein IT480_06380 [Gammaproteobacteria bacterium]|nr:hypothetical protein [Gammaproteobacteria bacterium]
MNGASTQRSPAVRDSAGRPLQRTIAELRGLAIRGLPRMYLPQEREFYFCLRRGPVGIGAEGRSRRYAGITLVGLAGETPQTQAQALGGRAVSEPMERLMSDVGSVQNLGDVALTAWAAAALGYPQREAAWHRMLELDPLNGVHATVELSWVLSAASVDPQSDRRGLGVGVAARLLDAYNASGRVFPHVIGGGAARSHIACFADMVYPIQSLSLHAKRTGDKAALAAAEGCAAMICEAQGPDGQWWWHYDYRSGRVVEGYPVYAVHQDSMAPMALFALMEAGGSDHSAAIRKGLEWLWYAPEIDGSLIDLEADLIWRKVARREPGKLSRYAQAAASRLHPALRVPGLGSLLPPGAIDFEDRPYHLGWVLLAFPPGRAAKWDAGGSGA